MSEEDKLARRNKSVRAKKVGDWLFSAAGFTTLQWVSAEEIKKCKKVLDVEEDEIRKLLPSSLVNIYYKKTDENKDFRTIMTVLRRVASYSECAIIRKKKHIKVAGKWKTRYFYKLCA